MGGCCDRAGYDAKFDGGTARRAAARYRRQGLDKTTRRMVAFLSEQGLVDDATVLEIGGGVGDVQIELLRGGALRTTNLELSAAYDVAAHTLAAEAGVSRRMTRRIVDLAATPDAVESHDIVLMHRVVCCYPDYEALLTTAADHANRILIFSHPPRNWVSRTLFACENESRRRKGMTFRVFAHPPEAMEQVALRQGLVATYRHRGFPWRIVALSR